ncbi:hypothetical protein HDU96_008785 [Phlyctochytrium bullatum]|nr:hypothetical protein HDU96_008785 [Phlyctochytrium bullatum]
MRFKLSTWLSFGAFLIAFLTAQLTFGQPQLEEGALDPTVPLTPAGQRELAGQMGRIPASRYSNAGNRPEGGTHVQNVANPGQHQPAQNGYRVDNQGQFKHRESKQYYNRVAVQKNGNGNGARTTYAQVNMQQGQYDYGGRQIRNGLRKSLRSNKVVVLDQNQAKQSHLGREWAKRQKDPATIARRERNRALAAQRKQNRADRANYRKKNPNRVRGPAGTIKPSTLARQQRRRADRQRGRRA